MNHIFGREGLDAPLFFFWYSFNFTFFGFENANGPTNDQK